MWTSAHLSKRTPSEFSWKHRGWKRLGLEQRQLGGNLAIQAFHFCFRASVSEAGYGRSTKQAPSDGVITSLDLVCLSFLGVETNEHWAKVKVTSQKSRFPSRKGLLNSLGSLNNRYRSGTCVWFCYRRAGTPRLQFPWYAMGMKCIIRGKPRNGLIILHPFSCFCICLFRNLSFFSSAGALFSAISCLYHIPVISHSLDPLSSWFLSVPPWWPLSFPAFSKAFSLLVAMALHYSRDRLTTSVKKVVKLRKLLKLESLVTSDQMDRKTPVLDMILY